MMFIRSVSLNGTNQLEPWARDVPAVKLLAQHGTLGLDRPVTAITGGNGLGKSTLLGGIARTYGFNLEGGTLGVGRAGKRDVLWGHINVDKHARAPVGYFLRAETNARVSEFRGGSHGENVMELLDHFIPEALYLLDEPESGLSAVSQMALLARLHGFAAAGAQIIMVTHSPILLGIPGAHIVELQEQELIDGVGLTQSTPYRAMRDFLEDPAAIADYMYDVTALD